MKKEKAIKKANEITNFFIENDYPFRGIRNSINIECKEIDINCYLEEGETANEDFWQIVIENLEDRLPFTATEYHCESYISITIYWK